MDQSLQVALIERVLAQHDDGRVDMAERSAQNPVVVYTAPDRFEHERSVLFRRYPLVVAHVSQLAQTGDYVTRDVAGIPVLVTRHRDGNLRAFLNVCRHRGMRLASGCGRAKAFACPYHAWTYGLDGALRHVPHDVGFPELDKANRGLVEIAVGEQCGLVFVVPRPGEPMPELAAYLGEDICSDLEGFGVAEQHLYAPSERIEPINWKLAIDSFLEGYHVKIAHRKSIAPYFLDNGGLFDHFKPHHRNVFPRRRLLDLRNQPTASWNIREVANILYVLFPNTLMLVEREQISVFHAFPDSIDATRLCAYVLLPSLNS